MGLQTTARPLGKHVVYIDGKVAPKAAMAKLQQGFQHH